MSIQQVYLGWDQPALPNAAEYLLEHYTASDCIDLSRCVVVLPGGLATRRLTEILVQKAAASNKRLQPPQVTTVGNVPELLYPLKQPFADDLTQQLAWAEAIRHFDRQQLLDVIPYPPEGDNLAQWREYGNVFRQTHRELASDGLDFATVAEQGQKIEGFTEKNRWQALSEIQKKYLARLDELNLWDKQTARLFAIEYEECFFEGELIFIGTVDMNRSLRTMLDQAASKGTKITSLVVAPESISDRFDSHGCLIPEKWETSVISIPDQQLHLVSGATDQANQIAVCLAEKSNEYGADEITIGIPDENIEPEIKRVLSEHQIDTRYGLSDQVTDSLPCRLLQSISNYLQNNQFSNLAELARHPDVLRRIENPAQALKDLDNLSARSLPSQLTSDSSLAKELDGLFSAIHPLIDSLSLEPSLLTDFADQIRQVLLIAYENTLFENGLDVSREIYQPCEKINSVLTSWANTPSELEPQLMFHEAISLLFSSLNGVTIPPATSDEAIEVLGWLELSLDDAPYLLLTSFNEQYVPSSDPADQFLPNQLRQLLSLEDDSRRYARDAYALQVILNSRQNVDIILAKRNLSGDPLTPSRLLFSCGEEKLPARVQEMFAEDVVDVREANRFAFDVVKANFMAEQQLPIPQPLPLDVPIQKITASDIRLYLKCPYRYYLEKVLKLRSTYDLQKELDAMSFGNLAHDTLEQFGLSDLRNSSDNQKIESFLNETLDDLVKRNYGKLVMPAVKVQVEQLRLRLHAFAASQAQRASEGWQIFKSELDTKEDPPVLELNGSSIELHGRIDRVDFHPEKQQWAVWDYKTGDFGKSPEKDHYVGQGENRVWSNVQLPFYRMLAPHFKIGPELQLGYICLPKRAEDAGFKVAKWSDEDFSEAEQVIRQTVENILDQRFYPPAEPTTQVDEYSRITQDTVTQRFNVDQAVEGSV